MDSETLPLLAVAADFQVTSLVVIAGLIAYKLTCILSGTAFAFMGYRLFLARVLKGDTDFGASAGKMWSLKITKAAPGTLFALFGAVIVAFSVFKGYDAKTASTAAGLTEPSPSPDLPDKLPDL
jgi:hypothetical protein